MHKYFFQIAPIQICISVSCLPHSTLSKLSTVLCVSLTPPSGLHTLRSRPYPRILIFSISASPSSPRLPHSLCQTTSLLSPNLSHAGCLVDSQLVRYAMRIQDLLRQCFIIYITLVLISNTVSCLHKVAPSHKKYIADSYFKEHNSLSDSKFEDYIAQEIAYGSCELLEELKVGTKIISLHQKLIGEGSHRHLSLSIRLESLLEFKSGSQEFCEAIIIERLPSGVFADSFELQHLVQRGVFTEAGVFGDTNLELPSFRSNRSLIEVHLDMGSKLLSRHKDEVEFKIELPLHARYQPLGHGYSRVEFRLPDVFMQCSIERKTMEKCLFPLSYRNGESKADEEVVWEIPCGDKEHAGIVSAITFMSAILSALLIILVSVYYSGSNDCPDLKQL